MIKSNRGDDEGSDLIESDHAIATAGIDYLTTFLDTLGELLIGLTKGHLSHEMEIG